MSKSTPKANEISGYIAFAAMVTASAYSFSQGMPITGILFIAAGGSMIPPFWKNFAAKREAKGCLAVFLFLVAVCSFGFGRIAQHANRVFSDQPAEESPAPALSQQNAVSDETPIPMGVVITEEDTTPAREIKWEGMDKKFIASLPKKSSFRDLGKLRIFMQQASSDVKWTITEDELAELMDGIEPTKDQILMVAGAAIEKLITYQVKFFQSEEIPIEKMAIMASFTVKTPGIANDWKFIDICRGTYDAKSDSVQLMQGN